MKKLLTRQCKIVLTKRCKKLLTEQCQGLLTIPCKIFLDIRKRRDELLSPTGCTVSVLVRQSEVWRQDSRLALWNPGNQKRCAGEDRVENRWHGIRYGDDRGGITEGPPDWRGERAAEEECG